MKGLLYTLTTLLFAGSARAQITISAAKAITPNSVDSCAVPMATAMASLTYLGTPATNATWDLGSTAIQSTAVTYVYRAKTSGFSTATYSDSTTYNLAPSPMTSYKAWRNIQQASGGVLLQGDEILTRQAKSLLGTTGNSLDSLVFPVQVISYNAPSPLRIIKFPATMGTVWLDSASRSVNFNVTVTAASLNNAPGQQRQRRIFLDSVVGWGSMKVPILGKTKSTSIPVLQVHHRDITLDSFFINGSPAPAMLLTPLGLSQGQSTTVLRTLFYRANATRPLIEMVHSAPSHTSPASTFYIHAQDLEEATAVPGIAAAGAIRVYPNPLRDNAVLHIDMLGNTLSGWSYSLVSVLGQQMAKGDWALDAGQDAADIRVPESLAAGVYYLMLRNAAGAASVVLVRVD